MTDRNSYWRRVLRGYMFFAVAIMFFALVLGPIIIAWYWAYAIYAAVILLTLPFWAAAFDQDYGSVK